MKEQSREVGTIARLAVLLLSLLAFGISFGKAAAREGEHANALLASADSHGRTFLQQGHDQNSLVFEANQGQTDPQVKFLSRGAGYALFFTADEAVVVLRSPTEGGQDGTQYSLPDTATNARSFAELRMRFVGGNRAPRVFGAEALPGKLNYFIGNDPRQWRSDVPAYAQVRYQDVYAGVSVVYYGTPGRLEYDLLINPSVDPNVITLECKGADQLKVDAQGNLRLLIGGGEVLLGKPRIYQNTAKGTRRNIAGGYVLKAGNQIGFRVGQYDHSQPLIVDPVLSYSTYLGGYGYDMGTAIAVDASGNAYVTGFTRSPNFPVTAGSLQTGCGTTGTCNGYYWDAFVTKLSPSGALVYSTFLGGGGNDMGKAIAVDSSGSAYVTGQTFSSNFPITAGAFQATYGGAGDAFVAKVSPNGTSLQYSTYLGGGGIDNAEGIAVDAYGNAYVTGQTYSIDFPTVVPIQPANGGNQDSDAFVAEINSSGSALVYSTYLGGSNMDWGNAIAVDASGDAYVTGFTRSTDFPLSGSLQSSCGGCPGFADAFVTELAPNGGALLYSTYWGGSGNDHGTGISVDSDGNIYLTGFTYSTDFPVTPGAYQTALASGNSAAFVTKIAPGFSFIVFSTYVQGSGLNYSKTIAVDTGNVFVAGQTFSPTFPLANPVQNKCVPSNCHYGSGFISELNAAGTGLIFSTYLSGSHGDDAAALALDPSANIEVTGQASSTDFPVANAFQATFGGSYGDAFVAKISLEPVALLSATSLTFGNQLVGTTSGSQTILLTSSGTAPVHIASITASGDFAQTNNCRNGVAAGSSCIVSVTFTPSSSGTLTGTLSVTDNAGGSPQTVSLTGTGGGPTPAAPVADPTSVNFTTQMVGTISAAQIVTLNNNGGAPLSIASISITGTNASDFAQTNTCGTSVDVGGTCTIDVTFAPMASGTRTAAVTIADNANNSPQSISLSGIGADSGCTKFVAPSGFDSSSGSVNSPWQHLQKAFNGSVAGDVVCLRAGTYPSQSTTTYSQIMNNSGVAANPITFQNFPGEVAVVQGNTRVNGAFVTFKGMAVTPPYGLVFQIGTAGLTINGVDVLNAHDVALDHVEIANFDYHAAYNQSGGCNNKVLGSYIHDNGAATNVSGIFWGSTTSGCANGGLIANNVVEHNGSGISLYSAGSTTIPADVTVEENSVVRNAGYGISVWGDNNVVANNIAYGNGDGGSNPQGTIRTGLANIVDHNVTFSPTSASRSSWYLAGGCCLTNNLAQDPLFASAAAENWHLTTSSPAIGFSNSNYIQPVDKDGVTRGPGYDTGAYQFVAVLLSPNSINFAGQAVNTTSTAQTVNLMNNGTTSLSVASISITGANAADFAQSNTCGTSVVGGGNCTISLTFTPSAVGIRNATLTVADSANGSPHSVSLTGTATSDGAPLVSLSASSLLFGSQPLGVTSPPQNLTLTNSGSPLSIIGIDISGLNFADFAQTNDCGTSVTVGGSCTFSVTITPTASGNRSATLSITDNAGASPQQVSLTGTGVGPMVTLSPASLSFASQNVGTTSGAKGFQLKNTGNASLTISSIAITGTNATDFAQTNNCPNLLTAGAQCNINVSFSPTAVGTRTASLNASDDALNSPQTASLTGSATYGTAKVTLMPNKLTFGNQPIGSTSAPQTTTLQNTGQAIVIITNFAISGPNSADFAQTNDCGTSVTVGASCTFSVTITPTASGNRSATLSITDNAGGSPQQVSLTGTGLGPMVTLSPTSLSFAKQNVTTTSGAKTIQLKNTGNASLTIGSIAITGTNATDFVQTNNCAGLLAPGAHCDINVKFAPIATGMRTAFLNVSDDAINSPQTANLSGTGQ